MKSYTPPIYPVQFVAQLAADAGMDTRGDELLDDDMAGAG